MADENTPGDDQISFNTGDGANASSNGAQPVDDGRPAAGLLAQYTKDLSFENPNAPMIFQKMQDGKPEMKVNVNLNARAIGEDTFEVELKLEADASMGAEKLYLVELLFAGVFQLRNIPEDQLQPFLLVEAPRLLFPFARRVLSDAVRDGGYPPLTLDPIDFAGLYQQQMAQQAGQAGATLSGGPLG